MKIGVELVQCSISAERTALSRFRHGNGGSGRGASFCWSLAHNQLTGRLSKAGCWHQVQPQLCFLSVDCYTALPKEVVALVSLHWHVGKHAREAAVLLFDSLRRKNTDDIKVKSNRHSSCFLKLLFYVTCDIIICSKMTFSDLDDSYMTSTPLHGEMKCEDNTVLCSSLNVVIGVILIVANCVTALDCGCWCY